jgi:hypothetical protein
LPDKVRDTVGDVPSPIVRRNVKKIDSLNDDVVGSKKEDKCFMIMKVSKEFSSSGINLSKSRKCGIAWMI